MPISRTQVSSWAEEAILMLETARERCTRAQKLLHSTASQLATHLPEQLNVASEVVSKMRSEQQILALLVEETKKQARNCDVEIAIPEYDTLLGPSLTKLEEVISLLKETSIPGFLIEGTSAYSTLHDFISVAPIAALQANIAVYHENCTKLQELLRSHLHIFASAYQALLKKYNRINSEFDDIAPMLLGARQGFDASNFVSTILKENTTLEHELVSILEMLTNHCDQCVQAKALFDDNQDAGRHVDLEVLANDVHELPEVFKDLNSVCEIIENNELRGLKYLNTNLPRVDTVIALASEVLGDFAAIKKTHIARLIELCERSNEVASACSMDRSSQEDTRTPVRIYAETVDLLRYHYQMFLDIYTKEYLQELHFERYEYPRRFLSKLRGLLNDELYEMQSSERERRRLWLEKYGDFIPKELRLPGTSSQPQVIQVITDGLEGVQVDESEGDEEHRLLELMGRGD